MTESAFRRLEVALSSLGIITNEVSTADSGDAGSGRLTESTFRRLEVALSSLGIIANEVSTAHSGEAGGGSAPGG